MTKQVNPVGDTTTTSYNSAGNRVSTTDGLGFVTVYAFDDAGRQLSQTTPEGHATIFTYDADGNQASSTDPLGNTVVYEHDLQDRVVKATDAVGAVTRTTYNRVGETIEVYDAKSQMTEHVYDKRGRRMLTVDRLGGITQFAYNTLGNLTSLTDAEGKQTRYTFDAFARLFETVYPDHVAGTQPGDAGYGIVKTEYDQRGRLSRRTDQLGDTVTFVYDSASHLRHREYRLAINSPSGTIADSDTLTYDESGNLLTAASERYDNLVERVYDDAGRVTRESLTISGETYNVFTRYNSRGQVAGYTYPDGKLQTRSYHPDGGLWEVHYDGQLVDDRLYDSDGRFTQSNYGNGVKTYHTYRDDHLIDSIKINYPDSSIIDAMDYSYDVNKNLLSEERHGVMSGYGFPPVAYDAEDRLTSWQRTDNDLAQSWDLSLVGDWNGFVENNEVQARIHTDAHEIATVSESGSTSSVSHDAKGNTTLLPALLRHSPSPSLPAPPLSLTWDFDNRLSTGTIGATTITYRFDALGRRVSRTSNELETIFVQSGQQTLADYESGSSASTPTYTYTYGSYIDEVIVRHGSSGTRYFHRNHQYSIIAMTNGGGTVTERYAYDAYGTPTIIDANGTTLTTSAENNRYTYTGREFDSELGLYHYRARMYDSVAGRFCSRDPIGYLSQSWSLYEYCASTSLTMVDPFGFQGAEPFMDWNTEPRQTILETLIEQYEQALLDGDTSIRVSPERLWEAIKEDKGYKEGWGWVFGGISEERLKFNKGCIGVASCMIGYDAYSIISGGDCFSSLDKAKANADSMRELKSCDKCETPQIIGHTWRNGKTPIYDENGRVTGYEGGGKNPGGGRWDFGFYSEEANAFFHAQDTFNDPKNDALISHPSVFHDYHGSKGWTTIYCTACSGSTPGDAYRPK